MLEPNFLLKEKYWPILSSNLINKHGSITTQHSSLVQEILIDAFQFLNSKLFNLLQAQKRASYVLFVHILHENSIDLYLKQVNGEALGCDEETFAATRRILKIIIEQTTQKKWEGCPDFLQEAFILSLIHISEPTRPY